MVLSNGMAKTSHWAALYFVALMTFGNYVLFNLLVAILVEGFSSERNERREREQRELARRKMSCILEGALGGSTASSRSGSTSSSGNVVAARPETGVRHDPKSCWRSNEELRRVKAGSGGRPTPARCNCRDRITEKECSYIDLDPKCNIQKESLLKLPTRQPSPPIITHTAATPQDSPSTTLDDFPEFRYSITPAPRGAADFVAVSSDSSPADVSSGDFSSQKTSSLSLLKPPSLSPPPLSFRHFEKTTEDMPPLTAGKIVIHNEKIGTRTMSFSEKVPMPPPRHSDNTSIGSTVKIQRKCSWKLGSKTSLKCKKRSGSDSEATTPLNNGRDHSRCNGNGVSRHASLRNDSLLQSSIRIRNDTQRDAPNNRSAKGLSPQNSIRCRSNTFSSIGPPKLLFQSVGGGAGGGGASLTRHNSLKTKNLSSHCRKSLNNTVLLKKTLPKVNIDETDNNKENLHSLQYQQQQCEQQQQQLDEMQPLTGIKKLMLLFEPTGCMKERDDFSLYLFPLENRFRQWCSWFVNQKWFDNVVLLFIAMNCITLAMERPNIPPNSTERHFLGICNYIFTVVFTIEMFVKVVASGMCYGPNAYFTSGWNIMDGSLVIISIVDLLMSLISESSPRIFGILRVFRLLRSLRPLRVINRAPGLKLVVQTLLSSLRPIGNIVLICCTFFIIFGILGVQLFKGTFYYCVGENLTDIVNRSDCLERDYKWENQKYNFDDLGKALMSLFVLSSRDGWVNIMYDGLDAVGVDQQPKTNFNEWRLLYFISFILLVGFFVLNMFVGVVVENFHRCREEQEKEERVRRAAKRALQLEKRRKRMNEPPYYINYTPWRLFIHNVVTSKYFDLAIAAVIGLNVVTMATESYKMPEFLSYVLKIFNYFFTAVFILESTMKLIALGFVLYMKDKWNQLDVVIVILSVIGIVLEELKSNIIPINPTVLRVMRVMRIARVLKLLKMAKGIRALLDTVMQALPQVGNLGLLFFLLFFIFAALGVELFGRIDCNEISCQGLGEHAHFKNFGMAFLTLFRVATGDNWNGIMKDTLHDERCDPREDCVVNCCVSKIIAPIFFVIFVLMAQFVLVNVVVAVLMKHLEESHKHLEDEQDLDNQLEREFQEKQEMEERRELCLALQLDQECQRQHKPLTKVLSLPSNFTYNPPGTKAEKGPTNITQRRQTLHSHQPINLLNMDDIKNIDESISDIYSIHEYRTNNADTIEKNHRQQMQTNLDEIITLSQTESLLKVSKCEDRYPLKRINETVGETNKLLMLPSSNENKSTLNKLYGSTKHLFTKQSSKSIMDITEETPFLLLTNNNVIVNTMSTNNNQLIVDKQQVGNDDDEEEDMIMDEEKVLINQTKRDSQESVQRIINERRRLDENLKEFNQYDIFDVVARNDSNNINNNNKNNDNYINEGQRDKHQTSQNEKLC